VSKQKNTILNDDFNAQEDKKKRKKKLILIKKSIKKGLKTSFNMYINFRL
jgi:hypothetical protein